MNILEYQQKAAEFAVYPRKEGELCIYPLIGMVDEAMEMVSAIRMGISKDTETEEIDGIQRDISRYRFIASENLKTLVSDEIGDVFWYMAMSCFETGIDMMDVFTRAYLNADDDPSTVNLHELMIDIAVDSGKVLGTVKKIMRNDSARLDNVTVEVVDRIRLNMMAMAVHIVAVTMILGLNIIEIAERNIKKLEDRKDRGVIKGDGDKR